MEYRRIGRSGLHVSAVGLGSWLTYGGPVEEEAARACVERAYDHGVVFFDTANVYGRGRAEEVVGRALAPYPRDSYVLATKVFFPMGDGPNDRGLGRKHVHQQCAASLTRLGVETIDLYQCHRWDEETALEETCRAMDDLVRQGKILYWGVSEWTPGQIEDAFDLCYEMGWVPPISNQPEYSALQRRIEREILETTDRLGMGNVVWSPLAQGVLTGKYRGRESAPKGSRAAGPQGRFMERYLTPAILEAVEEFVAIAGEAGVAPAQLALAWCLRRPEVASVIVGATSVEQVDENVAAADLALGEDVFEAVDRALEPVATG